MNPDTGHLIDTTGFTPEQLLRLFGAGYVTVPAQLVSNANQALAGQKETRINLKSGSKLARFAAKKRKERRRAAKKSRQKNRGK